MPKIKKNTSLYFLLVLLLFSCQQYDHGDTFKSSENFQVITGKVVPSDSLRPPMESILIEPKSAPFTKPIRIPKLNKSNPIQPAQRIEIPLSTSIQLGPSKENYPVSTPIISKPEFLKSSRVGVRKGLTTADGKILKLDQKDGLEFSLVNAMVQGPDGAIWGCSRYAGLWKYDGYQFLHFDESSGLKDYAVSNLFFDSDGDLWLGMTTGLAKIEGNYITHYLHREEVSRNNPSRLSEDHYGNIWVGSKDGLYRIDKKKNTISHLTKEHGLSQNDISSLTKDHLGRIWITYNRGGYSIISIQPIGKSFQYKIDNYNPNATFKLNLVQQVIETTNNQICIVTDNKFIQIENEEEAQYNMSALVYSNKDTKTGFNTSVAEDQNGRIWLAGLNEIVMLEARNGREINFITKDEYSEYKIKSSMTSMLVDKDNFLWIGYDAGLNRIKIDNPFNSLNEDFGIESTPIGPIEDQCGNIWFFAQNAGLYCLKKAKDKDAVELLNFKTPSIKNVASPQDIALDKKNNLWLNTAWSIFKIELFQKQDSISVKQFGDKEGFPLKYPHYLLADQKGDIWVTENTLLPLSYKTLISKGGGAYKISGNRLYKYGVEQGLLSSDTYTIEEDKNGQIWFNSLYYGLTRFDPNDTASTFGTWTHFKSEDAFQNRPFLIIAHPKNGIFIVNQKFTYYIKPGESQDHLHSIDWVQSLSSETFSNKIILYSFITNKKNESWIGYDEGVGRFREPINEGLKNKPPSIELFSIFDGFPTNSVHQIIEGTDGLLWFAGNKDLVSIDPQSIDQFDKETKVQITKLRQAKETFDLNLKPELKFTYQENYIELEFNTIDVNEAHKIEYRYQLLGYESKWSNPSKETKTAYPNLPHGSYTFAVASRIGKGDWGELAEVSFRISPPWWKSFLAYLVYSVLLLLTLALLWRKQTQRVLEKNKIEKELQEAANIRKIDEVKTQFFSNLSHEFRTPLTVILGMTDEIKENPLPKKLIGQSGQNLLRLVNQMLDFNKMEDGKLSLNLTSGELVSYTKYLLESFQSLAEHKNIELVFETTIKELKMEFDEDKIQHIISNLISNAIKFTPTNGEVKLSLHQKDDNQLSIEVKDSGIGMAKDQLPHIFDRFFQVKSDIRKGEPGTGIGLHFTKELVELMGGEISVNSAIGKGSTFLVLLPFETFDHMEKADAPEKLFIQKGTSETPILSTIESEETGEGKPHLLLIEDNPEVVAYIVSVLNHDYTIAIAEDGNVGIKMAFEGIPDIIISDVMMPFQDGLEVTHTLKSDIRTSHIPIILLTAKADLESRLEGLKSGADAYLAKPFDKTELKIRLENMVELRKLLQKRYVHPSDEPNPKDLDNTPNEDDNSKFKIEDEFLAKVNALIDQHLGKEDFKVDELSKEVGMDRSQLYRKLKALTNQSTVAYLRTRRLHKAKALFSSGSSNVSEVAYQVGFGDPGYFSKMFSKEFGISPAEYRKNR